MIRDAWYVALDADSWEGTPTKVRLMGRDLVVYQDASGIVHAVSAYCPHRGCDLSLGWVSGNNLTCPYHGWQFGTDGVCQLVPANRDGQRIPQRAKLDVYVACKENGWIWVSLTTADTSLPCYASPAAASELRHSDYHWVSFSTSWHAHLCRVVESVLDVSHLPFVHPEITGHDVLPVVEGPKYVKTPQGLCIYPRPFSHPMEPRGVSRIASETEGTEIELWFPNQWIIRTSFGAGRYMCTYLTFTPVDDETTVIWGRCGRNFDHDVELLDALHLAHTEFVLQQDQRIVESLRPMAPPPFQAEAHAPSDVPGLWYRNQWFRAVQ